MTHSKQQRGFTLIELVVAIAIIGISTAMISRLIVSGLEFAETTTSRSEDLLRARAFYETLLAIDAEKAWDGGNPPPKCNSKTKFKSADIKDLVNVNDTWPDEPDVNELRESAAGEVLYPLDDASCEKQEDAVILTIPVNSDGPELKLAIPK